MTNDCWIGYSSLMLENTEFFIFACKYRRKKAKSLLYHNDKIIKMTCQIGRDNSKDTIEKIRGDSVLKHVKHFISAGADN